MRVLTALRQATQIRSAELNEKMETDNLGVHAVDVVTIMGRLRCLEAPDILHRASLLISKHLPPLLLVYYNPLFFLGHLPENGARLGFRRAQHLAAVDPKDGTSEGRARRQTTTVYMRLRFVPFINFLFFVCVCVSRRHLRG